MLFGFQTLECNSLSALLLIYCDACIRSIRSMTFASLRLRVPFSDSMALVRTAVALHYNCIEIITLSYNVKFIHQNFIWIYSHNLSAKIGLIFPLDYDHFWGKFRFKIFKCDSIVWVICLICIEIKLQWQEQGMRVVCVINGEKGGSRWCTQ